MTYQDYIDLGFERHEWSGDRVNMKNFGYDGFWLEKRISPRVVCTVDWQELDEPCLLLGTEEKCERVTITPEAVKFLFQKQEQPRWA